MYSGRNKATRKVPVGKFFPKVGQVKKTLALPFFDSRTEKKTNMNTSNETRIADQFCRPKSTVAVQTIKVFAYVILILVSLIGNTLIIAVVYKNRRMRTPVNFFVVNMSAADILITVFYMPRMIARTFLGMNWGVDGNLGAISCKIVPFAQELSASVSVLTLILIAVDRFFAVLFPFKRVFTNRVAYAAIAFVWLSAFAARAPMFHGLRFILDEEEKTHCTLEFDSEMANNFYVRFAFVMFYVIPLFFTVVLYGAVLVSLKNRKPIGEVFTNTRRKYNNRLKRTRKVMNMLFVIVFVFAVCWCLHFFFPILFFRFRTRVCALAFPAFFLGHINSAINPCIYLIFIENYRRGFRQILHPLYKRCVNADTRVEPEDHSAALNGRQKSINASLTFATLDFQPTASTSQNKVFSIKTSMSTTHS